MIENGMMERENGFPCTKISTMNFNPIHSALLFYIKNQVNFLAAKLKGYIFLSLVPDH